MANISLTLVSAIEQAISVQDKDTSKARPFVRDTFPFERLPLELRLMIYLMIEDDPVKLRCSCSKLTFYLCSRGDTISMCPKAIVALSRVSRSIRFEVARWFTDGAFGMQAVFKQSMAVFPGLAAMSVFRLEYPKMAIEVRAAMIVGLSSAWETGGPLHYDNAISYWRNPETGTNSILNLYPLVTRIEMMRARRGSIASSPSLAPVMQPKMRANFDLRWGYTLHQEGNIEWSGRQPMNIKIYREIGE